MPGRGILKNQIKKIPMGSLKKFSQFGPAVWPAIANIYNYYIIKIYN